VVGDGAEEGAALTELGGGMIGFGLCLAQLGGPGVGDPAGSLAGGGEGPDEGADEDGGERGREDGPSSGGGRGGPGDVGPPNEDLWIRVDRGGRRLSMEKWGAGGARGRQAGRSGESREGRARIRGNGPCRRSCLC